MTKQRHTRPGDRLDDDDTVVVRGGELARDLLRDDAERYHSIYGVYGISVFAARDVSVDELAQQHPLVRFAVLTLLQVGALKRAGLTLDATGRNQRHFTLTFPDLESGIDALRACEHRVWVNPYHED